MSVLGSTVNLWTLKSAWIFSDFSTSVAWRCSETQHVPTSTMARKRQTGSITQYLALLSRTMADFVTAGQFMQGYPNKSIFKTVVILWLTLSIVGVILAAITWVQLSRSLEEGRKAFAVRSAAQEVLRLTVDAETGQRGYTITGKESFLEPYSRSLTNLPAALSQLIELSRQDSRLLQQSVELRAQIAVILNRLGMIVETRRQQGFQAAADIIATGIGKVMMDKMRSQVRGITALQSELTSVEGGMDRERLLRASLTSLVAGLLGIGAGIFAFWLSRMTLHHQKREQELLKAKLEAERNSEHKSLFLANMSHEIRTPMNAILGFSELLSHELAEPRHRQYLKSIRASADSLLQLINDILDMSKIEAGVIQLRLEPTDPRDICEFIHTVFSEAAAKRNVRIECILAEDLPRALLMDRMRLRQVMVNLVGNAVKFTDEGKIFIRVNWEKAESSSHVLLIIEVQDTGVGIPADRLDAIFKPFVQSGAHSEKERQGTGLGLSIVKRLTEMMGGTVTAASVLGEGSAFHLRFPNTPISARHFTPEKKLAEIDVNFNDLRPSTLLVVDDNEANCRLIEGMLSKSHHKLIFGSNGFEAVSQAIKARPDLVLLDIRMPGLDGRKALAQIRRSPGLELLPVVAVTASALMQDEAPLLESFSGYLRKPFSKGQLFAEVSQFLPWQPPTAAQPPQKSGGEPSDPVTPSLSIWPDEAMQELRRLKSEEWPLVRDSLAVNETKNFAEKLKTLGGQYSSPELLLYARSLTEHAVNYDVIAVEKELLQFGALVAKLTAQPPS